MHKSKICSFKRPCLFTVWKLCETEADTDKSICYIHERFSDSLNVMRLTNLTVGSNLKGHAEKGKEKAEFHNNDKRLSCMNVDYGQSVVFAKTFDPALPKM